MTDVADRLPLPADHGATITRADRINASQTGSLPDLLGFRWVDVAAGHVRGRFEITARHFSPHGYLHGATIVALADSACGFGCLASLPQGATGFVTSELKTNFIGTARHGVVSCEAHLVHGGRTTQVWDAEIRSEATAKTIALFRCTQMLLYPPADLAGRTASAHQS